MSDHYDEMSVSPDPHLTETLRRRLHARMAGVQPTDDPEDPSAHMKETDMSIDAPTSEDGNRWRIPAAAAALVAVIGVAVGALAISNRGSDVDDVPAAAAATTEATTTIAPTVVAPTTQTGGFAGGGDDIPVTFTRPAGWTMFQGWLIHNAAIPEAAAGVAFWDVGNIFSEGCQWVLVDPAVGPSVDDLVEAFANLPDLAATEPVDVTVDGFDGKQIEFTVPDHVERDCKGGGAYGPRYGLWQQDGFVGDEPNFWAQGRESGMRNRLWILDVDGRRLVIDAYSLPDTSPEDRATLDAILASVQIG